MATGWSSAATPTSRTATSSPPCSRARPRADREATVKTFKKVDGHVWLIPHNPAYTPIMADDAVIIGKVVTVLRRI